MGDGGGRSKNGREKNECGFPVWFKSLCAAYLPEEEKN